MTKSLNREVGYRIKDFGAVWLTVDALNQRVLAAVATEPYDRVYDLVWRVVYDTACSATAVLSQAREQELK